MKKIYLKTPLQNAPKNRQISVRKNRKTYVTSLKNQAPYIHPSALLLGKNKIGKNCYIGAFCVIENCVILDNTKVDFCSHLKDCKIRENCIIYNSNLTNLTAQNMCKIYNSNAHSNVQIGANSIVKNSEIYNEIFIGENTSIGPFSHVHDGCIIGDFARVGNFVELKKTTLKNVVKCAHLSYLGDCEIGAETNIGAGTIFCNYDGKIKHKSRVGNNCFIGSNCTLIAPICIENDCFIGAGSCVCEDLPPKTFYLRRSKAVTTKRRKNG